MLPWTVEYTQLQCSYSKDKNLPIYLWFTPASALGKPSHLVGPGKYSAIWVFTFPGSHRVACTGTGEKAQSFPGKWPAPTPGEPASFLQKESRVQTDFSELCSMGCWGKWGVHEEPPEHSNHLRSLRKPSCSGSSPDPFPQSLREEMQCECAGTELRIHLPVHPPTRSCHEQLPQPLAGHRDQRQTWQLRPLPHGAPWLMRRIDVKWSVKVKAAQWCPTLCDPKDYPRPWNSLGQNAGVGSLSLLQGIFPTQESNQGLLHCRWILYQLCHKGSPRILEWVAYPFSRGSSWLRNRTRVSCIAGKFFTNWAMREALLSD